LLDSGAVAAYALMGELVERLGVGRPGAVLPASGVRRYGVTAAREQSAPQVGTELVEGVGPVDAVVVREGWLWPPEGGRGVVETWVRSMAALSGGRLAGLGEGRSSEVMTDAVGIVRKDHVAPLVIGDDESVSGGQDTRRRRGIVSDVGYVVALELLDHGSFAAAMLSQELATRLDTGHGRRVDTSGGGEARGVLVELGASPLNELMPWVDTAARELLPAGEIARPSVDAVAVLYAALGSDADRMSTRQVADRIVREWLNAGGAAGGADRSGGAGGGLPSIRGAVPEFCRRRRLVRFRRVRGKAWRR